MVRLRKTSNLREKLVRLGETNTYEREAANRRGLANELPLELVDAVQEHLQASEQQQDWIDHTLLVRISKWNKSLDSAHAGYSLKELMRGAEVYIEPTAVKARTPELEAILAPILLAQERASYTSLISSSASLNPILDAHDPRSIAYSGPQSNVNWDFQSATVPSLSVAQEWEAVRKELSATANVVASMAAVATAVWWAAGNIPLVNKVLMALAGALGIGAVEAFLYIRFFQRTRAPKPKPKPKPMNKPKAGSGKPLPPPKFPAPSLLVQEKGTT